VLLRQPAPSYEERGLYDTFCTRTVLQSKASFVLTGSKPLQPKKIKSPTRQNAASSKTNEKRAFHLVEPMIFWCTLSRPPFGANLHTYVCYLEVGRIR